MFGAFFFVVIKIWKVEKSTVPVRTAEALRRILLANRNGGTFRVVSNPEFMAEGVIKSVPKGHFQV